MSSSLRDKKLKSGKREQIQTVKKSPEAETEVGLIAKSCSEESTDRVGASRTVSIKAAQVGHYRRAGEILSSWFVMLDNSDTGAGKTVVTTATALSFGLSLVVIAPPIVHDQWRETARRYSVPLLFISSYQKMRMQKTPTQLETSLVRRLSVEELAERGTNAPSAFEHTPFFTRLLNHGILLVFDEVHMLKTDRTLQLETSHCLIRALVHDPTTISRAALLSATQCDRFENAPSLLKMLGLLTHGTLLPAGVIEVAQIAQEINAPALAAITAEYGGQIQTFTRMKPKRAALFAYEVYRDIFAPWLASGARVGSPTSPKQSTQFSEPSPTIGTPSFTHSRLNGFFKFPDEDNKTLKSAYDAYAASLSSDGSTAGFAAPASHLKIMTQSLVDIEMAKVATIARLVRTLLDDEIGHPHAKAIVYFNYRISLEKFTTVMLAYAPLVLNGETTVIERSRAQAIFQRPSDEARLLVAHPSVGGVGINLDDVDGRFPRTQFVCGSFSFISICQTMGRVARASTMSNSESFLVFSSAIPEELRLLDNLSRKARTMRDYRNDGDYSVSGEVAGTKLEDVGGGSATVYPGEYASYTEP